jgi:hypothetical protein
MLIQCSVLKKGWMVPDRITRTTQNRLLQGAEGQVIKSDGWKVLNGMISKYEDE